MKTKTLFIALLVAMCTPFAVNAQITTGEPTAKVIRTGNRAKAGNFGLYLGATTTMFGNMFDNNIDMVPLPLINLKYMTSDNFELRVGLEAYKLSEKINGQTDADNDLTTIKQKYGESSVMLYPGFAYHFSKLNILDVYVGAELPLGWDSYTSKSIQGENFSNTTKRSFVLGLGAFVGLQAYVADLPLALGVEYGISSRLDTGLKYKTEVKQNSETNISYSTTPDLSHVYSNTHYDKLQARKGEIGGQLRLTLSYYFK